MTPSEILDKKIDSLPANSSSQECYRRVLITFDGLGEKVKIEALNRLLEFTKNEGISEARRLEFASNRWG